MKTNSRVFLGRVELKHFWHAIEDQHLSCAALRRAMLHSGLAVHDNVGDLIIDGKKFLRLLQPADTGKIASKRRHVAGKKAPSKTGARRSPIAKPTAKRSINHEQPQK